jgi:hypothetical protein
MLVMLEDNRGLPFEIKLGKTRLTKGRIDGDPREGFNSLVRGLVNFDFTARGSRPGKNSALR